MSWVQSFKVVGLFIGCRWALHSKSLGASFNVVGAVIPCCWPLYSMSLGASFDVVGRFIQCRGCSHSMSLAALFNVGGLIIRCRGELLHLHYLRLWRYWGGWERGGMGVKSQRQRGRQVEGGNGKSTKAGQGKGARGHTARGHSMRTRQREREWEGGSVHEQERNGGREKWQSTAHKDRFLLIYIYICLYEDTHFWGF